MIYKLHLIKQAAILLQYNMLKRVNRHVQQCVCKIQFWFCKEIT